MKLEILTRRHSEQAVKIISLEKKIDAMQAELDDLKINPQTRITRTKSFTAETMDTFESSVKAQDLLKKNTQKQRGPRSKSFLSLNTNPKYLET